MTVLAIVLAALSAVCLAYGAHFQHSAVVREAETTGHSRTPLALKRLLALLRSPRWLLGLSCMVAGMGLNVTALALAPVMVIQPVGALSLIISVLLGVYVRKVRLPKRVVTAVVLCVAGVVGFVTISALSAQTENFSATEVDLLAYLTLGVFGACLVAALVLRRPPQIVLVVMAGALFAFVATTVHVVSHQLVTGGLAEVAWLNVIAASAAGLLGSWLVQVAYASGPPEIVIAGLTVIDPIIAVLLGGLVLGEAEAATAVGWLAMSSAGAVACIGVLILAGFHPDARGMDRQDRNGVEPGR